MSSNAPVPVPRTAVPIGISDPVVQARTELKAALAAIEDKVNVPKRVARVTDERVAQARAFARKNPGISTGAVLAGAAAVGTIVWALVRAYTR